MTTKTVSKHPSKANLGILIIVLALSACEEAMPVALQEPIEVRVEGRVTAAETGAPLDSVDVLMTSGRIFIDEEGHASVTTDADGLYTISHRFDDECPGDLRLSVWPNIPGFQRPASVDLACTDGTRQVNFELSRRDDAG